MDFSSIKFPTQFTDSLAKVTIAFIVMLIICHVIANYIPKAIPPEIREIIGLAILAILIITAYKVWPYIPVLFVGGTP